MMSPELHMPGGVGGRRGQSRLLPDARVQANLHQYLSTHVIPAQAGIQEGERKNFWIPACAGMTFWNREKSRNSHVFHKLTGVVTLAQQNNYPLGLSARLRSRNANTKFLSIQHLFC